MIFSDSDPFCPVDSRSGVFCEKRPHAIGLHVSRSATATSFWDSEGRILPPDDPRIRLEDARNIEAASDPSPPSAPERPQRTGYARSGFVSAEHKPRVAAPPPPPALDPLRRKGEPGVTARTLGYTGDTCGNCHSDRMRRTGTCAVCEVCGTSGSCG